MSDPRMKRLDSSSDDDDNNHNYTVNTSEGAAPFLLRVPPTFANKHPSIVDRNGLVTSSLSDASLNISSTNPEKYSTSPSSQNIHHQGKTTHAVKQQPEQTWKRDNFQKTRFEGGYRRDSLFSNASSHQHQNNTSHRNNHHHSPDSMTPTCYAPRTCLPQVEHRFKKANEPTASAFFLSKRTPRQMQMETDEARSNHNLIPALVLPQHDATKLLQHDLDEILEGNKNMRGPVTSRLAGAKVQTYPSPGSVTSSHTSRVSSQQQYLLMNNKQDGIKTKQLLCQSSRSRPPPPAFSSVKVDDSNTLRQRTFLEDKDVHAKLDKLHQSKGKILLRQDIAEDKQKKKRRDGDFSPNSSRAQSKLSNPGSVISASSTSTSRSNKNKGGKLVFASKPPDENDYIEDTVEHSAGYQNDQEYIQSVLFQFDRFTLPPVIAATRRQQESHGKTFTEQDPFGKSCGILGSGSITESGLFGQLMQSDSNALINSPVLQQNSAIIAEAATGRVARTLFHAGLCQNLNLTEKLKTKISYSDLEKKLQNDFLHRRQISKEDFAQFLTRILREEYVNRREVDLLWTLLDVNGNGVLETRELRTELLKFVKTGIRDISFNFVAQLLEGRETHSVNAFISRFDIQNVINAIVNFYKDDKEVIDAVKDLPDKFQYKHHLARIPVAVFRDRILGDRKLLSIFQAVALEARKNKHEENAAKGIQSSLALGHFAPMSIPQQFQTNNNSKDSSSGNNKNDSNEASTSSSSQQHPQQVMNIRSNNAYQTATTTDDPNAIFLIGPKSEQYKNEETGEMKNTGRRRRSRSHGIGGGSVRVENKMSPTTTTMSGGNNTNSDQSSRLQATESMATLASEHSQSMIGGPSSKISQSRRSSQQSNQPPLQVNNNNGNNKKINQGNNNTRRLRRKNSSSISQQLAKYDLNSGGDQSMSLEHSQSINEGPESSSAAGIVRMIHNPITSADRFVNESSKKQDEAEETGKPKWYTKANVLYVETNDSRQPRPVFQGFQ